MNNKKFYVIVGIFCILFLGIGMTYAWLTWNSSENTNFTLRLGEVGEALFSGGNEISASGMGPVLSPLEEGSYTEFQILKKADTSFSVTIDFLPTVLPEELKDASFKYALYSKETESGTYSFVAEGDFLDKVEGTQFTISKAEVTTTTYYKLVIYIDGNMENSIDMQGQSFAGKIIVTYGEAVSIVDMKDIPVVYTYETGKEETFTAPFTMSYQLEAWGAQGGDATSSHGGYGGYATGTIALEIGDTLYINAGGAGTTTSTSIISGGYNGGGSAKYSSVSGDRGSGGGASSISLKSGLLNVYSSDIDSVIDFIIMVAGGGGGAAYYSSDQVGSGGSGGGYIGVDGEAGSGTLGQGGTQIAGGAGFNVGTFGQGGSYGDDNSWGGSGGGSGLYGGGGAWNNSGSGGGSGYIGNSLLTNKYMYCYNCQTSDDESTKTYSTTNISEEAISNYAKLGNGLVKITLLMPRISNLNQKVINLGESFDVTSDVSCIDVGNGCEIIETKIYDSEGHSYNSTSDITAEGTYEIRYTIKDNANTNYLYYRSLLVASDPTITTDATTVNATVGDTVDLLNGITALDSDGTTTLTPSVTVNGTQVTNTSGATTAIGLTSSTNTVVYTVTNALGQTATLTRTYTINTKSVTQYRKGTETTNTVPSCPICACGANGENTCVGCPVCPQTGYDTVTSCGSYGSWTTTYQSGSCVQTRTCTMQPNGGCS